jgi:MFS family permease
MKNKIAYLFSSETLARRFPFYYGWVMMPVVVIAQSLTGVGQTYGVSVFNPSFQSSLDISLSQLTGAYMIGTLLAAVPQSYIGSLMDRFGIRRVMTVVVVGLGLACIFISRVNTLGTLLVGFFLLRMLGQGSLSLLSGNIPPMWFKDKLGLVTGFVNGGVSLSQAVVPPLFLALIQARGWRWTYAALGVGVWVIMLPILGVLFRNHPKDVGQKLDGENSAGIVQPDKPVSAVISMDPRQARRTPAYWIALLNTSLWAMVVTAVFFNILPILTNQGVSDSAAAATFTTYAVASLLSQLLVGLLADRLPLQYLLVFCMFSLMGAVAVLSIAVSPILAQIYALLIGISAGGISVLGGTLWARYFGPEHLGKLRGGVITAMVAGSSVGPFITGVIFDFSGSYQISLWLFGLLLLPAAVASFWAHNPLKAAHED